MSKPLRVRRITDEEGRQLQRIVRRGGGSGEKSIVKWRRALVVLASAGGNDVAAIARLVHTSPDRVREMIHSFNDKGMKALDPRWAGGRPRRITTSERQLIVETARKRPRSLGQPFTRWSIRKLARYLATKKGHKVVISRERLRQVLAEEQITFQATKTWKESPDLVADLAQLGDRLDVVPMTVGLDDLAHSEGPAELEKSTLSSKRASCTPSWAPTARESPRSPTPSPAPRLPRSRR
jgi:transposase